MNIQTDSIPVSAFEPINDVFQRALAVAEQVMKGERPKVERGPFGENGEILPFVILQVSGQDTALLSIGKEINDRLQLFMRNAVGSMSIIDYFEPATMALYGFILGQYTDEDFRHVYRYALTRVQELGLLEQWIRKAMIFLGTCKASTPREVMSIAREWIQFLGATLPNPYTMIKLAEELELNFEDLTTEEDYRLVYTIRKHPSYLAEAVGERTFNETYSLTKEWLPDLLQSQLLDIYRKQINADLGNVLKSAKNVNEALEVAQKYFKKARFYTEKRSLLQIRLHEMPNPPPAEIMDTDIFEIIPPKLRKTLLPIMSYSSKIKRIEIIFLGGPRIGRSGILIKTDTGGVLMDYGLSVANQRIPEWIPELEFIDTVLVTHPHIDHIGGLPILYEKFTGKWCSTGITGAITKILLEDALNVGTPAPPRRRDRWDSISRFRKRNIDKAMQNHVTLEVGKSYEVSPGIMVTLVDACHIPGSVAYLVDIEGQKILYTGDFNLDKSILFDGATLPADSDYLVYDGTYWDREDFDRNHVRHQLVEAIEQHGPVIIPSFAVGRSQEILLLLQELGITKTRNVIVAGMTEKITKIAGYNGEWVGLRKNKVTLEKEDVLVAGGGMMSGGLALHYFKEHQYNPNAAIILCGYLAPRTTGWNLLHGYEPHSCHVEYARLSAHSSSSNLKEYINSCSGKKIMVHTPYQGKVRGIMIPDYRERVIINL